MEQGFKDKFNDVILQETMRRYGISADQIRPLRGFENFIYEFTRGTDDLVLRVTHTMRRTLPMVCGEVDWINYLADRGASVACVIPSPAGNLVEPIADGEGGFFLATSFTKAPGKPPWEAGWTPERYENYGRLIGRLHALTKEYEPTNPTWKRSESEEEIVQEVERWLSPSEEIVRQQYRTLVQHLRTLPKARHSFGLIHYDVHEANIFIADDDTITLFDFDDMGYNWFIGDIAMVIFYIVSDVDDPVGYANRFLPHFLRGYHRENRLDPAWLKEIPTFLKLREILLYALFHHSFDPHESENSWVAKFMNGRKARIEQNIPYLDLNFTTFATYLT